MDTKEFEQVYKHLIRCIGEYRDFHNFVFRYGHENTPNYVLEELLRLLRNVHEAFSALSAMMMSKDLQSLIDKELVVTPKWIITSDFELKPLNTKNID